MKINKLSASKLIDWYWDEIFFIRKKLKKDRFVGERDTYRMFLLTILEEINKEFEKENRDKLHSIVSDIHSDLIYL